MTGTCRTSFVLRPAPQNTHPIDWGPNGLIAVAFEHLVTVYQSTSRGFKIVQTISKHKNHVSCVKFSYPTVEISNHHSFQLYLAVGDQSGNCLIYDVFSGARHAGFSPLKVPAFGVTDLQWSPVAPTILNVLTTIPNVITLKCGSVRRRKSSSVEAMADTGLPLQGINVSVISATPIPQKFDHLAVDPYRPSTVVAMNTTGWYVIIQGQPHGPAVMSPLAQVTEIGETVRSMEYYPHAPGRLVIASSASLYLYDLATKVATMIVSTQKAVSSCSNVFSAGETERLWLPSTEGLIARLRMDDKGWMQSRTVTGLFHVSHFTANLHNPCQAALLTQEGVVCIVEDRKDKIFVTKMMPSFGSQLTAWTTDEGRAAFATDAGLIGVVYCNGSALRFSLGGDKGVNAVRFVGGQRLAVGSRVLRLIDLSKCTTTCIFRNLTPHNLMSTGASIAYNPAPNIVDIMSPAGSKQTIIFKDTIIAFACNATDMCKWCFLIAPRSLCLTDTSKAMTDRVWREIRDEKVKAIVYVGNRVILGNQDGDVTIHDIETGAFKVRLSGTAPIASMVLRNSSLLVVTTDNDCLVLDLNDSMSVAQNGKWRTFEACFSGDQDIVIRSSAAAIRWLLFPSFEYGGTCALPPTNAKKRFVDATGTEELEAIGREVGDLDFVAFVRSFSRKDGVVLPSLYSLTQNDYIKKERMTRRIEGSVKRDDLTEFFVLTRNGEGAASLLLESGNTHDILFAYACNAPNVEAARKLTEKVSCIETHSPTIARLLVLGDDYESAVSLLDRTGQESRAFHYIRMLADDARYREYLIGLIAKRPGMAVVPVLRVAAGDYHGALALLLQNGMISKAHALFEHFQHTEIVESPLPDHLLDLTTVIEKTGQQWTTYCTNLDL